jgi:tight adherence protein B
VTAPDGVSALAAAALAGLAVALALPARPGSLRAAGADGATRPEPRPGAGPATVAVLVATVGACVTLLDGTRLVAGLAAAVCLVGVGRSVRQRRADRDRARRRALVVEVGDAMAGELRAGRPPQHALARAAEIWPELGPVVAAARLDSDVPTALRDLGRRPGAEGLADLAAAWQVSARSGSALAASLAQVVASARARDHATSLVAGELASARATARLVALLPLGTLAMASGIGASPWAFLVDHPVGAGCLLAGVVLVVSGLAWIDRIASTVVGR